MSSHWARIAINLFLITRIGRYKKIVENFVEKTQTHFEFKEVKNENVLIWQTSWDKRSGLYQDTAHGNAVVSLIIELYERNMAFNDKVINCLVNTFNILIFKSNNNFASRFDGTGNGSGWFTDGLIKLGRYDKNLQLRIEEHKRGRSTQFYAHGALNAKKLSN